MKAEAYKRNNALDEKKRYKHIWDRDGKILMRKYDSAPDVIHLKTYKQLNDIFARAEN